MRFSRNRLLLSLLLIFLSRVPAFADSYDDYLNALGHRESSNNYAAENYAHYLGKYQFGAAALNSCKLYTSPNLKINDWSGTWLEESTDVGVSSSDYFLANHGFQEFAIRRFNEMQWASIVGLGLTRYLEKTVGGVHITKSGMLGGAHLVGPGRLKKFLNSDGQTIPVDGNGTKITEYLTLFADYNTPFH
jgi:hypothetical protein